MFKEISDALGDTWIDLFEPPPAKVPLFDSRRDYLAQIDRYRAWQQGTDEGET